MTRETHNLSETVFYLPYHPFKVIKIMPKKLLSFPGLQNILSMIEMKHAVPLFNFLLYISFYVWGFDLNLLSVPFCFRPDWRHG